MSCRMRRFLKKLKAHEKVLTVNIAAQALLLSIQVKADLGFSGVATSAVPGSMSSPSADLPKKFEKDSIRFSAAAEDKSPLDAFEEGRENQNYTGKPITLQVRDADVTDILRLIGAASGFNMVIGEDVKGKVTLSLEDVPWDQVLDLVLHTQHLSAERNKNILRISSTVNYIAEKEQERKVALTVAQKQPRITKIFQISYAKLTDLQSVLVKFASTASSPAGQGATGSEEEPPVVQADPRTNSLVVRDTAPNIERMRKLIELLDTQTPQVMIEAKIVEATESFSKTLSGSLGFGGTDATSFVASAAGANPLDPLIGAPGVFADGKAVGEASGGSAPKGTIGISPSVSFIPGVSRLNAILNLGENENQLKIVSSPKTVVMNQEQANIIEGTPVLVPGTTTVAGVGTVPAVTVQQANISLNVTPTVTNDGSVLLKLNVAKDVPVALSGGNAGIGNRNIQTLVLVESGSTLVIGGIYTMQTSHSASGVPWLRKLPIIGTLFGSESDSTDRSELFIFVTPRILNVKEAGLSS